MLKKIVPALFLLLLFSYNYAELYEVRIDSSDVGTKHIISSFDVLNGSLEDETHLVYILDSSPEEIMQLNGIAEINEILNGITILPSYSDLESVNSRIDNAIEISKGFAKSYEIGRSIEDRTIRAVRISKSENTEKDLPEVLFVGLHHAREWISAEVALGILEFLVVNMDSNPFVSDILDNAVIWFVPMLNPDGFLFSQEKEQMWRYNRRVHPDESIGVDLNRNYDSSWIKIDFVHGDGPFSEPETTAVKNLIMNSFDEPIADGIKYLAGLISYHSFGQLIMYPPGSTEEPAEKYEYYKSLAERMSALAFSECGSNYIVMQNSQLYFTFGEMTEWFMNTHDGAPAFTFELRPHMGSEYYFSLPAEQIRDTVKENITPALYFVRHLITGETVITMDIDNNGRNDIIEKSFYDYKCDRSDLEINDGETGSDDDIEQSDGFYGSDSDSDSDNDKDETSEVNDDASDEPDSVTSATQRGCSLIITGG